MQSHFLFQQRTKLLLFCLFLLGSLRFYQLTHSFVCFFLFKKRKQRKMFIWSPKLKTNISNWNVYENWQSTSAHIILILLFTYSLIRLLKMEYMDSDYQSVDTILKNGNKCTMLCTVIRLSIM